MYVFKGGSRRNYSCEAAKMLICDQICSPRLRAQLRYSRFVNTQGRQGKNVPLDLHCEHLNRLVKDDLTHTGSNLTTKSVERGGRSVGVVACLCHSLSDPDSTIHARPTHAKDLQSILDCLHELQPFKHTDGRAYTCSFNTGLLQNVEHSSLTAWLKQQHHLYSIYKL